MAKGGYRLYETISVHNLMRFFKALINVNSRGLLN